MNANNSTQEFNDKNSVYHLLYNFIVRARVNFLENPVSGLSKKVVKRFIESEGIFVNYQVVKTPTFKISQGDQIQIPSMEIDFKCVQNGDYIEESIGKIKIQDLQKSIQISEEIIRQEFSKPKSDNENKDDLVLNCLREHLDCNSFEELKNVDSKKAVCQIIRLLQEKGFEEIKMSKYSYDLVDFLKSKLSITNIARELSINKSQLNTSGNLIEILIQGKLEKESNLRLLNDNLISGHYDGNIFKYLQDYKKIHTTDTYQYFINPLLNNNVSSQLAVENLLKAVHKSSNIDGIEAKYHHYEESKPIFVNYFQLIKDSDKYCIDFFLPFGEKLFKLLKENCNTAIEKSAQIKIEPTIRKYNFSNTERLEQEIYLIVTNNGEGLAKGVEISSWSKRIQFSKINVGILKPNEKREVSALATICFDDDFKPELEVKFNWEEISGKKSEVDETITFHLQHSEIPWEELKKQNPYSNSIIENVDKLFGREEILNELKSNILSDNIESYKLWGQKRVGKSSIVKTLKSIFDKDEKVIIVYRSLGGLKNTDAFVTLNVLGESLCAEVYEEIDRKIKDPSIRERLRSISVPQFSGSLYPLENYIKNLKKIDVSLRFVFILDEFDRINEEFFLPGNLGETLSLSIGKGLNEYRYVGFILVGSENMHLLDRHGINYNSFQEREVDTFHKQREYNSFVQIVKGPVSPYINYSDDAIDKIFFASNGNPYFANLICFNVFKNAYKYKDTEVDAYAVSEAISLIVNSSQKSHFEHYWSDGITEESNIKKERKADVRRRILVSFSMSSNPSENHFPNKSEIARNFKKPVESEYEIEKYEVENTITEFINRKIFIENDVSKVRILPNLFESWLCGKGKTLMIEGVSDLEALQREFDLEKELDLKPDELSRLSENYPFRNKTIAPFKFSEYFKQFGSSSNQRRVFKLIDSIYFVSKADIIDFYRKEVRNIFTKTEIYLKEKAKTIFREDIEIYTFSKYYAENASVIESFKILNHIRQQKTIKSIKSDSQAWKRSKSDELIIIEPIIDNFSEIQDELFQLLNDEVKTATVTIRLVSFVITTKAKSDIITATSSFVNFKLVAIREVEETKIKPFIQGTELFENLEEANQALFEVRNHFPNISKDSLLVLFEDYCPSKSCPCLWHQAANFKPLFVNEVGILEGVNSEINQEEERRTRVYHANTKLSQALNKYIIDHLKNKAKKNNKEDWFIRDFIPKSVMESVSAKWISDGTNHPKESYFDFADYEKTINSNPELVSIFTISGEGLSWCTKLNVLRRDPAHPEKPAPTEEEATYFEKITMQILSIIG